ncbi:MAG: CHAT domain-containing protein [Immundisolibacter sp.]|uniref:CHAT domain-containing protein n=1 Tax=Immundisolibacter sp. TaxID=1934948 RepID=UPI003D149FA3
MSTSEPTVLDVSDLPHGLQLRLVRPGEPFAGPTQRIWNIPVTKAPLRNLCRLIEREIRRANAGPAQAESADAFGPICEALLDELFSERVDADTRQLREALRTLDTPLLITSESSNQDPGILWELLKLGGGDDDYLALRCPVGRRLKTPSAPRVPARTDETSRCLLIADPNSDEPEWALPASAREAQRLRTVLGARGVDCSDFLIGAEANFDGLFKRLVAQRYEIIHFAGHVVFDAASGEYGLRLHAGELLTASSVRKHLGGAPLVFLNACASSATRGAASNRIGCIEGMTNAFLEAGARIVVGSPFDLPDEGARLFAEKFYEGLLAQRPVGEAVRQARRQVRGVPGCGAAWASFVLYGDPGLSLRARSDSSIAALQPIGLARADFDPGCLRLLERAFEHARGAPVVATAHLLAALIDGESSQLRDRLRGIGVPTALLSRTFAHVFARHGDADAEAARLSDNVAATLRAAADQARGSRRSEPGVTELDLLQAFAHQGGGSAGELLRAIGVDLASLVLGAAAPAPGPQPIGPLARSACKEETWQTLVEAGRRAAGRGRTRIGSADLLAAVLQDPHGAAAARGPRPPSECSRSVHRVLEAAAALAEARTAHSPVEPGDLRRALFARAGAAAAWLNANLDRKAVGGSDALFDPQGALRTDRFDAGALRPLAAAVAWARAKQHLALSRGHLLYAMLADPGSQWARCIGLSGVDATSLAERFDHAIAGAGDEPADARPAEALQLTSGLVGILNDAERRSRAQGESAIGERHLVHAMLDDGCGESGRLLATLGVDWGRLRELAASPPAST